VGFAWYRLRISSITSCSDAEGCLLGRDLVSDMARTNWCEKRGAMRVLRNKVFMKTRVQIGVLNHGPRSTFMLGLGNHSRSSMRHACRHRFQGRTISILERDGPIQGYSFSQVILTTILLPFPHLTLCLFRMFLSLPSFTLLLSPA
jgi:hypothetical protein